MASAKNLDLEKALEYMDPMQVTDYLHKILDFLQRNNNEIYFPSISPYVEAFLVNLASDTRNLRSKLLKHEDRKLALDIIDVLEMSRDVFRWTHSYENGNLLVYKKIFSNKMKRKPKPSSIAHRLLQAQTQQSTVTHASSLAPTAHARTVDTNQPDIPVTTTSFKLRFLKKTLSFIKDDTESTLFYKEMPYELAEYISHLIKYRDKEVGFGYKSLYAPLWEAMEEYGVDYKFEVRIEETSGDNAILILEKVPKRDKATRKGEIPDSIAKNSNGTAQKDEESRNTRAKRKQDSQNPSQNQPSNSTSSGLPPLELLSHISERFFKEVVVELTHFAHDEGRASFVFHQLSEEEIAFVKRVKTLAESSKVREMFSPEYRDLLWRLDYSIKEVLQNCKITTTVNDRDRSITLKKTPTFATPLPVTQRSIATGARSKSLAPAKTRDRSISKDRLIQFEKGSKLLATGSESNTDNIATGKDSPHDRATSKDGMSKRAAKLLEDLSTPIESDKGIRMMLLMGWNGGALGARGDGIMEPVMPSIDLRPRGGLGHAPPPPPPTPRRPLDFRLMLLHGIYDLLLHEDPLKEIQFKDPLVKKECKFIVSALGTLNKRRALSLTEREGELLRSVVGELAGRPGLEVRSHFSTDLRIVTLHKLTNQPVKAPKLTASKAKPKPVKNQSDVITITDDDPDVLVTALDVMSVMPHVDVTDMKVPAHEKAIRKRAVRLIFLTKFAEALHWGFQPRTVFKFHFTMSKKLKIFIRTIVDDLNKGVWHSNLLGWETQIYKDLLDMARGSVLAVEKLPGSKIVLTRTPLMSKDSVNAGPILRDNNNDDKTDNRNQTVNLNGCTNKMDIDKINSKEENINVVEHNVENQRLIQASVTTTSNLKDAISNVDLNNKDEKYGLKETSVHAEGIADNSKNTRTAKIIVKGVNRINAEFNSNNSTENDKMEGVQVNIESECDIAVPNVKESNMTIKNEVNNYGMTESGAKIKILDTVELSDLDRDIEDLEMTILKADLDCVFEKENDNDCDLDMAIPKTDLKINVNKEQDIDYLNTKRSHSSSVCSQELDSKKGKISTETDEHILTIIPKNPNEKIREETVIQVQTLMANEIDKTGGFLPLLKCHGVENGGLIYSCHDEDDVAWLKNVISAADLDVEIVPSNDLYFDKKSRELLFKINSYIPLDTKKIFHKFEMYNVGLNTKHWKVSYKHTETTFIMFIVTVDEKSFKYISDEKFSLYCGIDKTHFSVIF